MLYNRGYDFQSGNTIVADEIDNEFNLIKNVLNGNIDSQNIADASITLSKLSASINPVLRTSEIDGDYIVSGIGLTNFTGNHTTSWANRNETITAGIAYIRGERVVTTDYPITFAVSSVSWVDLDTSGIFHVTVSASEPAVFQNSMRVMKITTDGTKITEYQPLGYGDVGDVTPFAGKFAPKGYALCQGGEVSRTSCPKLWQVIGSIYGTPSTGMVKLPDTRARTVHGHGDPTYYTVFGGTGGAVVKNHAHSAWTDAQGAHGHNTNGGNYSAGSYSSIANYSTGWSPPGHTHSIDTQGSHGHNVGVGNADPGIDPYITMNYKIKLA